MSARAVQISKTLSYWLRHKPDAAGLQLSSDGWADVDTVLASLGREHAGCDWTELLHVVETNDKKRFELSADAGRIRARQGHSVEVDLDWPITPPPDLLYHGTVDSFLAAILVEGLRSMARHHVHLSADIETANRVGQRRGAPVILVIDARRMEKDGHVFRLTGNGVWLADAVPPDFLGLLKSS
jgi:putative RNA 2'-phosphotransferase